MLHLTEDAVQYKSDLKHTSTEKSQAEEQEKKARDELRATNCELWMARDELQIAREELKAAKGELLVVRVKQQEDKEELQVARDELRLKTTTLSRVCQEVAEVEITVGRLNEECHGLCDDIQRQQALVSQKEGVIAELRDEACTLWAFGWLAFCCKASKVFPGLSFNFSVPAEDEVGESDSNGEDGLGVSLTAPNSTLLPGDLVVEAA